MKLIAGLGNPGGEYESSRHNIGFMVLDKLAKELGEGFIKWQKDTKHNAETIKISECILIKPQTYMNKSGDSIKSMVLYYKLNTDDVWVVHDDIDLPLGKIRIRNQGASGGHNGVDSIINSLGTDKFVRFRLGVGRGKELVDRETDKKYRHKFIINYVLSKFRQNEAGEYKKLIKNSVEAVRIALTEGLDKAINRFN